METNCLTLGLIKNERRNDNLFHTKINKKNLTSYRRPFGSQERYSLLLLLKFWY